MVDDVVPDGVINTGGRGEHDLGSHPVGCAEKHGVVEFLQSGSVERATERTDAAEHAGGVRGLDFLFEQRDGTVALVDVDAAGRIAAGRAGQLAPADVAAELASVEMDIMRGTISAGPGFLEIRAGGGDAEHAAARGDGFSVRRSCSGMADGHLRVRGRFFQTFDLFARPGFFRIPGRGENHSASGRPVPTHAFFVQAALDTSERDIAQRRGEQGQQGLRLGVAETAIVFDQFRTLCGHHQPCIEHADIRSALGGQTGDGRADDGVEDAADHFRRTNRGRCIRPHAAGVCSAVAFKNPFVILRRRHGGDGLAVGEDKQRDLGSGQSFLEEDGAGCGEADDRFVALRIVFRNDHAFAGSESIGFDHHGKILRTGPCLGFFRGLRTGERGIARRGESVARGEGAAMTFARLEQRGLARWSEHFGPRSA